MFKTTKILHFLFFYFFIFLDISSAEIKFLKENKKNTLNLIDVIELALKNNPKVKEAWLNVEVSDRSYKVQRSEYFPEITGKVSYSNGETEYDISGLKSETENITPSITLDYLLFNFGGKKADIDSFKYKLEATKLETNSYIQNFIYNVVEGYYKVFSSMANEKASKEAENSSYEAFKAAKIRYDIGLAPLTDKLQAETSYMQKKLVREQAENNVKIKKAELNYLLNLSPTAELNLSLPSLTIPEGDFKGEIEVLFEKAIQNRPDLKAFYENKKSKKSDLYGAKVEWLPSVSFSASYQDINDLKKDVNDRSGYNLGVSASMPFFTGGSIYNKVAKTKSELKIIDQKIYDLEKNIELEVWTAYQNFMTAKRTYITSETLLKSATETEKTMLGRYKNGKSSILDLLNAQTELATARYEFISAQHNWFTTRANLLKVLGQMSIENLSSFSNEMNLNNNNLNGNKNENK